MEEKKNYKIGLFPLILLILDITLIIVAILIGIIIYYKKQMLGNSNNDVDDIAYNETESDLASDTNTDANEIVNSTINQNQVERTNNTINNVTNNTTNENKTTQEYIDKVVENRSYIYDAQYDLNGLRINSYSTDDNVTHSITDIIVPYINMTSMDANEANSEIQELYNKCVEEFQICSQNKIGYIKVDYQTYITSNIYSILLTIQRGNEETITEEYLAYNFDCISGAKLDYNQICYIAGINNANESIQKTINQLKDYESYYLTLSRDITQEAVEERNAEINAYKNQVYTYYQEDLLNNKLIYFLDNNLKLNVVMRIVLPNGEKSHTEIVIIE